MPNPNALVAVAQVSKNSNNPYFVFCEYIKYCLTVSPSDTMLFEEIKNAVYEEFGLSLPNNILLACLKLLKNDKFLTVDEHSIRLCGSFDATGFDDTRKKYKEDENSLINSLIAHSKKFNKDWNYNYAREQLIKVLDGNNIAYNIFVNNYSVAKVDPNHDDTEENIFFSDNFIVGNFIEEILQNDSAEKEYLQRICEGLMICIGAYQIPSPEERAKLLQIKDTYFFFDTRLLLRFLGCAGSPTVEAAKELVKMIQDGGGKIFYYQQTLEEMTNALDDAYRNINSGYLPSDNEMRLYALQIKNRSEIIAFKKVNLKDELAKAGIFMRLSQDYTEKERIDFSFDKEDFQSYISANSHWDPKVIENDVSSIWETHMLRMGNYNEYCGTNEKIPVFVTTNSQLVNYSLKFKNDRPGMRSISSWKRNRLPVITDIQLTCRLWSPSEQCERLSLLYLSSNVVAAKKPTPNYINSIRTLVCELKEKVPEYSNVCLPAFFDDRLTDTIFEKTLGNEENLNLDNLAGTLEEFSEFKVKDAEEEAKKVKSDFTALKNQYASQSELIIESAVKRNSKKFRLILIPLLCITNLCVIIPTITALLSLCLSAFTQNCNYLFVFAISVFLVFFEKIVASNFITKWLVKLILPKTEKAFKNTIKKALTSAEAPYSNEIIKRVFENCSIIKKAHDIIK